MSGYDQLHDQLRNVVQRRAERQQRATWRRRISRALRVWPMVAAGGVSIAVMGTLIAVTALRAQPRAHSTAAASPQRTTVLGASSEPITAPTCPPATPPAHCHIILTRMTALPSLSPGLQDPTTATASGSVMAFTLGIARLYKNASLRAAAVKYLNEVYGAPQAIIAVLAPVGAARQDRWVVTAQSPPYRLQSDLGTVATFMLPSEPQIATFVRANAADLRAVKALHGCEGW